MAISAVTEIQAPILEPTFVVRQAVSRQFLDKIQSFYGPFPDSFKAVSRRQLDTLAKMKFRRNSYFFSLFPVLVSALRQTSFGLFSVSEIVLVTIHYVCMPYLSL